MFVNKTNNAGSDIGALISYENRAAQRALLVKRLTKRISRIKIKKNILWVAKPTGGNAVFYGRVRQPQQPMR